MAIISQNVARQLRTELAEKGRRGAVHNSAHHLQPLHDGVAVLGRVVLLWGIPRPGREGSSQATT